MQIIEFYITTHNQKSASIVKTLLNRMQEYGDVVKWQSKADDETVHFSVSGNWAAYSTVSTVSKNKKGLQDREEAVLISIEHFEED